MIVKMQIHFTQAGGLMKPMSGSEYKLDMES
jgi:hypothetical protein